MRFSKHLTHFIGGAKVDIVLDISWVLLFFPGLLCYEIEGERVLEQQLVQNFAVTVFFALVAYYVYQTEARISLVQHTR